MGKLYSPFEIADPLDSGGGTPVVPGATAQTWPAAFTTTDPGAVSWTWTAPDGSDQTAHLTGGNGDTSDYVNTGAHLVLGWDGAGGTGNIVAVHEITLGSPAAAVPGAMTLPDWDTLSKHDPRSYDNGRTANTITLDGAYYSTSSADFIWLYTTISIPTGKNVRLWYVEDGTAWTQRNIHCCPFVSSDATDPAGASTHLFGGNFRYWLPNRGKNSAGAGAMSPSVGAENTDQFVATLLAEAGPDGECSLVRSFATTAAFVSLQNNKLYGINPMQDLDDVAHIGIAFGRTQAQAAHVITGTVYVEVF